VQGACEALTKLYQLMGSRLAPHSGRMEVAAHTCHVTEARRRRLALLLLGVACVLTTVINMSTHHSLLRHHHLHPHQVPPPPPSEAQVPLGAVDWDAVVYGKPRAVPAFNRTERAATPNNKARPQPPAPATDVLSTLYAAACQRFYDNKVLAVAPTALQGCRAAPTQPSPAESPAAAASHRRSSAPTPASVLPPVMH
jgi:hypothetical protein